MKEMRLAVPRLPASCFMLFVASLFAGNASAQDPSLRSSVCEVEACSTSASSGTSPDDSLPDAPPPQTAPAEHLPLEDQPHSAPTLGGSVKNVFLDLGHIAISPIYVRPRDLEWIAPLAGASAAAFATDTHTSRDVVSHDASFDNGASNASNAVLGAIAAFPVALYADGVITGDEHAHETGVLGAEAMVDALATGEAIKLITWRERPNVDSSRGNFFQGNVGANSSFVSEHSIIAWSSAAVIAGEYRNPWARAGIYTMASGVSIDRVLAEQHFPSDVLIGSAAGWLIGHYVYRAHHHWQRRHGR